ncbi:aldose 1-epimerase [Trueperella pecoris]|uniref:Aldose 1-epimerase n=1 Tax=Trueperella pecoris TaxID=2733571 RepID=A0A7M1QWH8_9ACTO|nr:aldose 1-epimerase [Trueperella pecoris]QOR45507.1 aldose 1-epimerase [Trueperella pecoris]
MIIQLTNGSQRLTLSTRGATIFDWDPGIGTSVLDGYRSLAEQEENDGFRNAVLAPWSNRTEDATWDDDGVARSTLGLTNAEGLHGLVWSAEFEVVSETWPDGVVDYEIIGDHIELATTIPDSPAYPGPVDVRVRYDISDSGKLGVRIAARNAGGREIPVALGWHPYVRVEMAKAHLQLAATHAIVTDDRLLPLPGEKAFRALEKGLDRLSREISLDPDLDTGFTGLGVDRGWATAHLDTGLGYEVEMSMKVDNGVGRPNFHVFTGAPLKRDPLKSLALEPCLTMANMLNRSEEKARVMVQPGETRTLEVEVVVR